MSEEIIVGVVVTLIGAIITGIITGICKALKNRLHKKNKHVIEEKEGISESSTGIGKQDIRIDITIYSEPSNPINTTPPLEITSSNPKIIFDDVKVYDNYIKVTVTGGESSDWYRYYITTIQTDLWDNPEEGNVTNDNQFIFRNLQADTKYYLGVICYSNSLAIKGSSNATITTRTLINLQHYEVYDRQAISKTDHTTIKANTEDTVYFKVRFFPNPDYLGRFDVNNDGVVDERDVEALQQAIDGTYIISNRYISYNYAWVSTGKTDTIYSNRGDINKDGIIDQDDVERLKHIVESRDVGSIAFLLYTKSDFDAQRFNNRIFMEELPDIPSLTEETVINRSFSGLEPDTEYVVTVFSRSQKHYGAPWDSHSFTCRTASKK